MNTVTERGNVSLSNKIDGNFGFVCVLLSFLTIFVHWLCLPFRSGDMGGYLIPWLNYIASHGRFGALADNFYDYPPAYIYLIDFMSLLKGYISDIILVKVISIAFNLVCSFVIFKLA